MWRDYIGLLPSIFAVINGFIALFVAQFFKDHHKANITLVVMAALLGAMAIAATSIRLLSPKRLRRQNEPQPAKNWAHS
jgi:hypothetical protein